MEVKLEDLSLEQEYSLGDLKTGVVLKGIDPSLYVTNEVFEDTITEMQDNIEEVENITKGLQKAKSFMDYETLIEVFNDLPNTTYIAGQIFNIATTKVPDLWVYSVEEESVPFTYTNDEDIVNLLDTDGIFQVGYYKFGAMETGKVDLTDYVKNTDYATATKSGLTKLYGETNGRGYGLNRDKNNNGIYVAPASYSHINSRVANVSPANTISRVNDFTPITSAVIDYAVQQSLVNSKLVKGYEWTDEDKLKARATLGVDEKILEVENKIPQIELTLKDNGAYKLTVTKG